MIIKDREIIIHKIGPEFWENDTIFEKFLTLFPAQVAAEPYIHQEPIAAPVAVAAAPVAYAAAPVAYAAAAPVAAATYAAAAPVATATYGYTTPIATAAYAPAAYSGYYAAAPAVAIAKHH